MNELGWLSRFALACLASVALGLLLVGVIVYWQDGFRSGATLSGLNPRGGPGFVLLLLPAVVGWQVAARGRAQYRLTPRLCGFGILAGTVAALVEGGARLLLPADFPPTFALSSSAGLALFVAATVTATLQQIPTVSPSAPACTAHNPATARRSENHESRSGEVSHA